LGSAAGLVTAGTAEEWFDTVAHWTQALSNVSLAEFVLLAALTTAQWIHHRIRGAGWVALSFAILGALSLTVKIDPGLVSNQTVAKVLIAVLLLMPYCLFRFAASFRTPSPTVSVLSAALTIGTVAFTFALRSIPVAGHPEPPYSLAYRVAFVVAFGFLFSFVVVRLFIAGRGEPPIAATRMRLLAVAIAGLEVQVVVSAFGLGGSTVTLLTRALTVAMGLLLLAALVLPSFVQVLLHRRGDEALRRAIDELVSVGDSRDVAEDLLPHVCALVGASKAALLTEDGTIVARYPVRPSGDGPDVWAENWNSEDPRQRVTVQTKSGTTHALVVKISPYMTYFGSEELRRLDQLADMVGKAIERCEMAEQMAFQASHDGLTGLANRSLFMERLREALSHVGRRRSALSVLFIDLDHFKLVNDRADHSTGDLVLNEMADRLTDMTRGVDMVARFGGDEFVALVEVDHEKGALDMAERIRAAIATPLTIGGAHLVVTASIGLVVTAEANAAPAAVLRDADNAMYEAKRLGRDQVVLHRGNGKEITHGKWGVSTPRGARLNAGYSWAKTPPTARFDVDAPGPAHAGRDLAEWVSNGHGGGLLESDGHGGGVLESDGHGGGVLESNGHGDRVLESDGRTGGKKPEPRLSRLRRNAPLFWSSMSLSSAAGLGAFGGFIYWLLIARISPAHVVGTAAALYSSVQFVNYMTGLGLPIAVARYGSSPKHEPSVLFNWSVVLTVVSSFIGAAVYFAIVPHELHELTTLGVAGSILVFGLIVSGISVYTVLDVRLISQQRRGWVVWKAAFVGLVRLPFVFVPGIQHSAIEVFFVAAGAPALCGFAAWILADLGPVRFRFPLRPLPENSRAALSYAVVNGAAQLAVQGPFYALPVIVLLIVTPQENASFYVAWTIATVSFLIVQGVGQALLVEGHRSGRLGSQTRSAIQIGLVLATALFALCLIGSRLIPILYGASYTSGAEITPILGAALIPWSVFTVILAVTRVRHNQRRNIVLSSLFALSILVPGVILVVKYGISGAAWAWFLGNLLSAVGAMLVLRKIRREPSEEDEETPSSLPVELLDNAELL
jgi:diguanylate cyclase (GGDEF)-like protein